MKYRKITCLVIVIIAVANADEVDSATNVRPATFLGNWKLNDRDRNGLFDFFDKLGIVLSRNVALTLYFKYNQSTKVWNAGYLIGTQDSGFSFKLDSKNKGTFTTTLSNGIKENGTIEITGNKMIETRDAKGHYFAKIVRVFSAKKVDITYSATNNGKSLGSAKAEFDKV